MALVLKDRVQETTVTPGTSDFTLDGAVLSYQTFAAIGNGNTTYYAAYDAVAGDWEVGIGTYSTTGPTLARTTILSSSNGGSIVSFGAGTKNVFSTYPSERGVWASGTDVVFSNGSLVGATSLNITGATAATSVASTDEIIIYNAANGENRRTTLADAAFGSTLRTVYDYTATAGQTTFSATYLAGYLDVYRNGVKLAAADVTATNGTTFTISACNSGDVVQAISYQALGLVNTVTPGKSIALAMIFGY